MNRTDIDEKKTRPKGIRENALWNAIGCLFYMGCQWLTTVLVVSLSPNYDNSGILAFAMAVGLVFYAIGAFAIRPFQVSDIHDEYDSKNYIAFRLITNLGSYCICAIYLAIITRRVDLIVASLLYMVFKFDESFSDVLYGIYQKNDRMDYIGKSQAIRGFISLTAFSIALWLTSDIFLAITSLALACICVTILYDLPHARYFGPIKPFITKTKAAKLFKSCFIAMLANLMLVYVVSAVRQYYGITAGDSDLGIYAAIATPAVVVQAALGYIYSPFIGPLARSLHESRRAFLRYFAKILVLMIAFMFILSIILCFVGPPFLLLVFGESISPHVDIFPYVIASTALVGLLGYFFATLVTMRKQVFACVMTGAAFAASLLTAIPLIAIYGMNGVNLGIISGCLIGFAFGLLFVSLYKKPEWTNS